MAYANKYTFSFNDLAGDTFTGELAQDGFVGSVTSLSELMTRSPVQITFDTNETDIGLPIRPSTCTVSVAIGRDFSVVDFFSMLSATAFEYKLTIKKNGTEFWVGYFKPVEAVEINPFTIATANLVFIDGLIVLKSIALPYNVGNAKDYYSYMNYVYYILDQTGLDLDIKYISTLYKADDADMPIWAYLGCSGANWLEDNTQVYKSCWDVLTAILTRICCCVYQQDGEWRISNLYEAGTASRLSMTITYGALGNDSAASITSFTQNAEALESSTRRIKERNLTVRAKPNLSKIKVISEYGPTRIGPTNYNFDDWTGSLPVSWQDDNLISSKGASGTGYGSEWGIELAGYYNPDELGTNNYYVYSTDPMTVKKGDRFIPFWKFELLQPINLTAAICRIEIELFVSITESYWLKEDGTWDTNIYIMQGTDSSSVTVGGLVVECPADGNFTLRVYRAYTTAETGQSQAIDYIRCQFAGMIFQNGWERTQDELNNNKFTRAINTIRNNNTNSTRQDPDIITYNQYPNAGGELPYNTDSRAFAQSFTGAERNSLDDWRIAPTYIKSTIFSEINAPTAGCILFSRLYFFAANRFELQIVTFGDKLQVGQQYTYDLLGNGSRTFICLATDYDIRTRTTSAILVEADTNDTISSYTIQVLPE